MLRAEGHQSASRYPFGYLWNEVRFVQRRNSAKIATDAILMQGVIASCFDKQGAEHLKDLLEKLGDGIR